VENLWKTCGKLIEKLWITSLSAKNKKEFPTGFPQVFHKFSTGFPQVFHRFFTTFL